MNLKGRSFLTLRDFTPEEILYLIDLSAEVKEKKKNRVPVDNWRGQNVALIFEKDSTRTRCSFEVAAHDMGMGTTYLGPTGSQIGKKETIEDTARVLGRMFDGTASQTSITRRRCSPTCSLSEKTSASSRASSSFTWATQDTIWATPSW